MQIEAIPAMEQVLEQLGILTRRSWLVDRWFLPRNVAEKRLSRKKAVQLWRWSVQLLQYCPLRSRLGTTACCHLHDLENMIAAIGVQKWTRSQELPVTVSHIIAFNCFYDARCNYVICKSFLKINTTWDVYHLPVNVFLQLFGYFRSASFPPLPKMVQQQVLSDLFRPSLFTAVSMVCGRDSYFNQ